MGKTRCVIISAPGFSFGRMNPCSFGYVRLSTIGILIAVLLAACAHQDHDASHYEFPPGTKGEGGLIRDESDKPYYANYWQKLLTEHPHPKVALRSADVYFDSLPFAKRSPHRDKVRVEYLHGFFEGITYAGYTIYSGGEDRNTVTRGFQDGISYHHDHPDKFREIMEGFGYVPTEAEGTWSYGFEQSDFCPRGASIIKAWWLWPLGNAAASLPKDAKMPKSSFKVKIVGFLSPKSEHEYLGACEHEFFATRITLTKRN